MSKVYAVIPALNEEATIALIVKTLLQQTNGLITGVIVVDDGSSDKTGEVSTAAGAIVLKNPRPTGYDSALAKGINHAIKLQADAVVTCDADGQHPVEELLKVVNPVASGEADFCAAMRDHYNRPMEKLTGIISKFLFNNRDPFCGLKCYSRKFLQETGPFPDVHYVGTLPFVWCRNNAHLKTKFIEMKVQPRADESRFGDAIRGNVKLGIAFLNTLKQL